MYTYIYKTFNNLWCIWVPPHTSQNKSLGGNRRQMQRWMKTWALQVQVMMWRVSTAEVLRGGPTQQWKQGPWLFSFFGGIALPICMAILIFVVNNQASIESRADFFRGSTPLFLGLFTLWIVQKSSWPTSWYCMVDIPFLDRFFCTSQGVIVGIFPSIKRYTLFFLQLRLNNFQLATFLVLQSHT